MSFATFATPSRFAPYGHAAFQSIPFRHLVESLSSESSHEFASHPSACDDEHACAAMVSELDEIAAVFDERAACRDKAIQLHLDNGNVPADAAQLRATLGQLRLALASTHTSHSGIPRTDDPLSAAQQLFVAATAIAEKSNRWQMALRLAWKCMLDLDKDPDFGLVQLRHTCSAIYSDSVSLHRDFAPALRQILRPSAEPLSLAAQTCIGETVPKYVHDGVFLADSWMSAVVDRGDITHAQAIRFLWNRAHREAIHADCARTGGLRRVVYGPPMTNEECVQLALSHESSGESPIAVIPWPQSGVLVIVPTDDFHPGEVHIQVLGRPDASGVVFVSRQPVIHLSTIDGSPWWDVNVVPLPESDEYPPYTLGTLPVRNDVQRAFYTPRY